MYEAQTHFVLEQLAHLSTMDDWDSDDEDGDYCLNFDGGAAGRERNDGAAGGSGAADGAEAADAEAADAEAAADAAILAEIYAEAEGDASAAEAAATERDDEQPEGDDYLEPEPTAIYL